MKCFIAMNDFSCEMEGDPPKSVGRFVELPLPYFLEMDWRTMIELYEIITHPTLPHQLLVMNRVNCVWLWWLKPEGPAELYPTGAGEPAGLRRVMFNGDFDRTIRNLPTL